MGGGGHTSERLLVRAVARSPIGYVRPWSALVAETYPFVPEDALPGDRPVVTFPAALHAAIGRELKRRHVEGLEWLREHFEGVPSRRPGVLLEPPESMLIPTGDELLVGGRPAAPAWHAPQRTVAYLPREQLSFGLRLLLPRRMHESIRREQVAGLLRAVERAGWSGIGPETDGDRGRLDLLGAERRRSEWRPSVPSTSRATLRFVTPAVLRSTRKDSPCEHVRWERRMVRPPTFSELWDATANRLRDVDLPFTPDWRLDTTSIRFEWREWGFGTWRDHFAKRAPPTHKPLFLTGIVGEMSLEGPIAPFLPFLQLAGTLGIGDRTSLGMGRFYVADERP